MNARQPQTATFKPFRYSQLGVTPSGERRLMIRAGIPDRNGPSLEILMASGKTITSNEITQWFVPLRFVPTASELAELAYTLNLIRVTKPREEAVPNPPELQRVASALDTLSSDVPALRNMQHRAITQAGPDAHAADVIRRAKIVAGFDALLTIVQALRADPFLAPPPPARRKALWHRDLRWVAFLLEGIARKHGATVSLIKPDAPAVGLLHQALARAGIHQARDTIAKEMQRSKKEPLPEIYVREGIEG